MTPQEMRVLFDYNAWANRRSLEAASALTAEKFVQPLGSSFGSVRDTLAHIWGAEWIWLERFQGRSPSSLPDATQFPDMASLRERWDELEMRLLGFVRGLTQADLAKTAEIAQGFLSEIENGLKTGDVTVLQRIATALEISLLELVPDLPPSKRKPGFKLKIVKRRK